MGNSARVFVGRDKNGGPQSQVGHLKLILFRCDDNRYFKKHNDTVKSSINGSNLYFFSRFVE